MLLACRCIVTNVVEPPPVGGTEYEKLLILIPYADPGYGRLLCYRCVCGQFNDIGTACPLHC